MTETKPIQTAAPAELTADETAAVAGGNPTAKKSAGVGPASYNVHSTPAGAGPAFYNLT
jgi:hypothetical protein